MTILESSDTIAQCGRNRVKRVCYVSEGFYGNADVWLL